LESYTVRVYTNPKTIKYYSYRYEKYVTVPKGYRSDGASGAIDVCPKGYYVHDWICGNYLDVGPEPVAGVFDDDSKCTNWMASNILGDILAEEGFWIRRHTWLWATYFFGGSKL